MSASSQQEATSTIRVVRPEELSLETAQTSDRLDSLLFPPRTVSPLNCGPVSSLCNPRPGPAFTIMANRIPLSKLMCFRERPTCAGANSERLDWRALHRRSPPLFITLRECASESFPCASKIC